MIAPEPFGKRIVPNKPKADGGDTWAENTASRALDDDGNRNPCEVGAQRNGQQRQRNRRRPCSNNCAPRFRYANSSWQKFAPKLLRTIAFGSPCKTSNCVL